MKELKQIKKQQNFEHRLFKYNLAARARNPSNNLMPSMHSHTNDEVMYKSALFNRKKSQNILVQS
jgi:hypothetical protein